ncbi:MAG: hypothetical protein O3B24_11460 [Verrucomicrobia bacterium]|nr:hypothetical protein [Verrucomicrobiota bacterium]
MDVILTIDVESYTGDYAREVFAGGLGLDFIVQACRRQGMVGTFFVEALGATRWGREPLQRIVADLNAAGQDVQLHLHPVVARIEGFEDHEDVLCHRDRATQTMLLARGLAELRACGAHNVLAFRAGDLGANVDTLAAMEAAGLRVSANRDLDQKSSIRSRLNDHFPARNDLSRRDGILDIPVTALRSPLPMLDGPWRHMEISAMGLGEMCHGLDRLARAGYACAGILTHPGEFFRQAGGRCVPIAKNCRRLEGVLAHVGRRPGMRWTSVAAMAARADVSSASPPDVRAPLAWSLARLAGQALDRVRVKLGH